MYLDTHIMLCYMGQFWKMERDGMQGNDREILMAQNCILFPFYHRKWAIKA